MTQSVALRAAGLAAVARVAAVGAIAIARHVGGGSDEEELPPAVGTWYRALAAPYPSAKPSKGACGVVIDKAAMGVANPVLPCGVKIYMQYNGKQVLTQVIDRGPDVPGREFDVTRALAKRLGLVGTRTVQWRFAR
jgi:rare lipoprotein A (peptidoglycan hydrolase)